MQFLNIKTMKKKKKILIIEKFIGMVSLNFKIKETLIYL